jgi:hypothetical protein
VQAIREVVQQATGEELPEGPSEPLLEAYGSVALPEEAPLLQNLDQLSISEQGAPIHSTRPLPMEAYGMAFGMLAYRYPAATKADDESVLCCSKFLRTSCYGTPCLVFHLSLTCVLRSGSLF